MIAATARAQASSATASRCSATTSLPKIRLKTLMRTQASSTQSDNPLLFSGNAGERLIEEEGDLLPPALLGRLPNLEYIGRLAGGRTIKGRLPILVGPDAMPAREPSVGSRPRRVCTDRG
jgi:conjugal transfer pilus assembly protein TraD